MFQQMQELEINTSYKIQQINADAEAWRLAQGAQGEQQKQSNYYLSGIVQFAKSLVPQIATEETATAVKVESGRLA